MSDQDTFDKALGAIPSGIFVLTIAHGADSTGMLASWVMQAGFSPPMVTVAVRQGRYVAEWLTAGRPFVLNIVGESDKILLKHFGRGFEPGADAFSALDTIASPHNVPVLTAAIGYLECEPVSHVDSGDHHIFLAKVTGGAMFRNENPMVHLRKSGQRY